MVVTGTPAIFVDKPSAQGSLSINHVSDLCLFQHIDLDLVMCWTIDLYFYSLHIGWFPARILKYYSEADEILVECNSEPGLTYTMNVKKV